MKNNVQVIKNLGEHGNGTITITRNNGKKVIEYDACTIKEYRKYKKQKFIDDYLFPAILYALLMIMIIFIITLIIGGVTLCYQFYRIWI